MAMTETDLFSFAQKCEWFNLRLESGRRDKGRGSAVTFFVARYDTSPRRLLWRIRFPAKELRAVFQLAQHRANELGQEIRITMEASLKEEYDGGLDDSRGVATVRPQESPGPIISTVPSFTCSHCSEPATVQVVVRFPDTIVIEHSCAHHENNVRNYWK